MKYGLIGESLSHSLSKDVHARISDYSYDICEIAPEELKGFCEARDFEGINVTIPYKEKIIPLLDEVDDHARRIGSVNTVINRGGRLYGYNTDFGGLCGLILHSGIEIKDKRVLILGKGGTAKTAQAVCESLGAAEIRIAARKSGADTIEPDDYDAYTDSNVIINATPVGMYPDCDRTPVDINRFTELEGVIDCVFNPIRTRLVTVARSRGIKAEGGLYMLVRQAVLAAELFTGDKIPYAKTDLVYGEMLYTKENMVLIGLPGCGKSTVANAIFAMTGRICVDIATEIEKRYGPTSFIIKKHGEQAYHELESKVIKDVASRMGIVISTSGGTVLNDENVTVLRQNGKIFFIDRSVDMIAPNLGPAAAALSLDSQKYSLYGNVCDVRIDGDRTIKEVAESVIYRFKRGDRASRIRLLVINGPNLNMLGVRQPEIYGMESYADLTKKIEDYCKKRPVDVAFFQSNHEGAIIDKIQEAYAKYDGLIINPAAYTHTSVAIADAISAVMMPTVEVHISDINAREPFRKINYISPVCSKTIMGQGTDGYLSAVDALIAILGF
ncbi:MAG: type II 3-dehydroquinate dehydratase [Clostridia bacterium]|nr:type II 3-dehydroquinate dehydratase [Clostridia bacterium]